MLNKQHCKLIDNLFWLELPKWFFLFSTSKSATYFGRILMELLVSQLQPQSLHFIIERLRKIVLASSETSKLRTWSHLVLFCKNDRGISCRVHTLSSLLRQIESKLGYVAKLCWHLSVLRISLPSSDCSLKKYQLGTTVKYFLYPLFLCPREFYSPFEWILGYNIL